MTTILVDGEDLTRTIDLPVMLDLTMTQNTLALDSVLDPTQNAVLSATLNISMSFDA